MTPGQEALKEAARLEAARVYGRVVLEHKNPPGLSALVAEAELAAKNTHIPRPDDGIVDDVAVERRCKGEQITLTTPELVAAIHRLAGDGLTPTGIAKRLHLSYERVAGVLNREGAA